MEKIALQHGGWWICSDDKHMSTSYAWFLCGFWWTAAHTAPDTTTISTVIGEAIAHDGWLKRLIQFLRLLSPIEIFSHNLHESLDYMEHDIWSTGSANPVPFKNHSHTNKYLKTADLPSLFQIPLKPLRILIKQFVKCKSLPLIQTISMPVLVSDFYQALYLLDIVSAIGEQNRVTK